ncbi:5212_t:CDS:1, partial [Acaulospora colombiana]
TSNEENVVYRADNWVVVVSEFGLHVMRVNSWSIRRSTLEKSFYGIKVV